jgi:gentisate 1,2-dioxygenase
VATTKFTARKTWQELTGDWYESYPFRGAEPYPAKVTPDSAYFLSWGPDVDGLNRAANPIYFSTKALTTGFFYLAPGAYWRPDNHPNPESYIVTSGTLWVGNPDTGQFNQLEPGDAYVIPAFTFHWGHNFGDETVEVLFMIARQAHTDQLQEDPILDDHYDDLRKPVVLHAEAEHRYQRHPSWAQPGYRAGEAPESRLDDLLCWPPRTGKSVHHNVEVDNAQIVGRKEWLHLVTGGNYQHQFLTSFCYSTNEFQMGKIRVPPARVTNAIKVKGERVYYPQSEAPLIVVFSESGNTLVGKKGDGLFVPANVTHQFQNMGNRSIEALFVSSTCEGVSYY